MTVATARPLLHAYSGEGPYELIESKWGKIERWRAVAQETGELSALVQLNKQIRNDSAAIAARLDAREAELNARADAISTRELQHAVSVTNFVDFVGKASVLFDKLQNLRADQAEEPLSLLLGRKAKSLRHRKTQKSLARRPASHPSQSPRKTKPNSLTQNCHIRRRSNNPSPSD